MLLVFCLECRIIDRELTVVMIALHLYLVMSFTFQHVHSCSNMCFWWAWPWTGCCMWGFWNLLETKFWHIMRQPTCCSECAVVNELPCFPVVCWVKTAESEVSVHGTMPPKPFLPALCTPSCANWIWIMEEQIIWCLWCSQKERWYMISSLRWRR